MDIHPPEYSKQSHTLLQDEGPVKNISAMGDDDDQNLLSERKPLLTEFDVLPTSETPFSYGKVLPEDAENDDTASATRELQVHSASEFLLYPYSCIEANGCLIDVYARATIFMSSFFVGPALLKLASSQAIKIDGCLEGDKEYDECVKASRIYGFKPSSLLTNMGAIASLIAVVALPIFGAVVDFTSYRRQVGMYTAFGVTLIKVFELGLGPSTWFFVVCLQIISNLLYQTHSATMYSYSAELSNQPTTQSKYQSSFALVMFASMFLYMLEVLIPSRTLELDDIGAARIAIFVSIVNSGPLFSFSWIYFFQDKPPASKIPHDQNILTAGFRKLASTFNEISNKYTHVKHFLIYCIVWSEASAAALPTIATTYMSEFLEMDSLQIGMVLLIVMIGGMPGSLIGDYFCRFYRNPLRSAQICLTLFSLNTLCAGLILRESNKNLMYGFSFIWGICHGWMRPQHMTIFVTITPQENGAVELMGLFLFSCQILSFLPPLVFTILNEMGAPMWVGITSLAMYSLTGLFGLLFMVDYEAARNLVS